MEKVAVLIRTNKDAVHNVVGVFSGEEEVAKAHQIAERANKKAKLSAHGWRWYWEVKEDIPLNPNEDDEDTQYQD